jgi:hypothetical protein
MGRLFATIQIFQLIRRRFSRSSFEAFHELPSRFDSPGRRHLCCHILRLVNYPWIMSIVSAVTDNQQESILVDDTITEPFHSCTSADFIVKLWRILLACLQKFFDQWIMLVIYWSIFTCASATGRWDTRAPLRFTGTIFFQTSHGLGCLVNFWVARGHARTHSHTHTHARTHARVYVSLHWNETVHDVAVWCLLGQLQR